MEEVGDNFSDGLLVVDEGFQNLRLTIYWDDVVIGDGSWHETGITFGYGYFITGGADLEFTIAIQYHEDDEGVVLDHVAMERLCGLDYLDGEEWGIEDLVGCTYVLCMFRAVFGIDLIVDGL